MRVYISFDVEANGPIPGKNSMLSLGAVAVDIFGNHISKFSINIEELPNSESDPKTMEWWQNFLPSYDSCRKMVVSPEEAIGAFDTWAGGIQQSNDTILVANPSAMDIAYLRHYYSFVRNPKFNIGFMCLDIQSVMATYLKIPFELALVSKFWPMDWKTDMPPYTHIALDDAIYQAELLKRVMRSIGRNL